MYGLSDSKHERLSHDRISRKRSPGERPYAVIKIVFKSGHTMVTTIARVHTKMIFAAMSFNLCIICTFKHRGVILRMLYPFKKTGEFKRIYAGIIRNFTLDYLCT